MRLILNIILLSFICCTVFAEENIYTSLEDAKTAYLFEPDSIYNANNRMDAQFAKISNLPKMFHTFQKYSDAGNYEAMGLLAKMYDNGDYVKMDNKKAVELFKTAASHGDLESKTCLANFYLTASLKYRNYKKAVSLLKELEKDKYYEAYTNLGLIYQYGIGVKKNYKKAVYYFTEGAKHGISLSQFHLGYMYLTGKVVKRNYKAAFENFKKSASQHLHSAEYLYGYMLAYGKGTPQNTSLALFMLDDAYARPGNTNKFILYYYSNYDYYKDRYISIKPRDYQCPDNVLNAYRMSLAIYGYCHGFYDAYSVKLGKEPNGYLKYMNDSVFRSEHPEYSGCKLENNSYNKLAYSKLPFKKTALKSIENAANNGCLDAAVTMINYNKNKPLKKIYWRLRAQELLYTDDFDKVTKDAFYTAEEYYGRPYVMSWLHDEAKKGNIKAVRALQAVQESREANIY